MDELIGTQRPHRRLTDADEAIAELERAVPGFRSLRRAAPQAFDWPALEAALGAPLPADYKRLCELYPVFVLGDFLSVHRPVPGRERDWPQGQQEDLETVMEWCEDSDPVVPLHPYPAPGGLLPWGGSNQGDFFLWTTSPAGPQEWTVTVASRNGAWWHYAGGLVQFLADLVGGAPEPWGLPVVRPGCRAW
ncbi:SMI1/KNR4 family protein [Kitasatospora sp. NPDC101183]|uniref:SMI1/KNR4 family protein n=1 Tax=Kitasatospora sp. NPDC101183 TaxID=3364100 RepID=UPI003815B894